MPQRVCLLTNGGGEKGNHFRLLPIVVKGQVPDPRIQVLDETGLMAEWGDSTP